MYKQFIEKIINSPFVRFGVIGALNSGLNILIYWICVWNGMHYLFANTIGFVITVAVSYVLNNVFTFRNKLEKIKWSILALAKSYISYFFTGIIINSILLWYWNDFVGMNQAISPILNLVVTVPLNYIMNKLWVYKK